LFKKRYSNLRELYVKSPFHDDLKEKLYENHLLVIEGLPKIGKSFLARNICLDLLEDEFHIMEIDDSDDIKLNKSLRQVYLCDDIFGSNSVENEKMDNWKKNWNYIENIIDERHFLLCTSRSTVLYEASTDFPINFEKNSIRINITNYEKEDLIFKEKLLDKYIENSSLSRDDDFTNILTYLSEIKKEIIEKESFFPQDIKLLIMDVIPKFRGIQNQQQFGEEVFRFLNQPNTYLIEEIRGLALYDFLVLLIIYSHYSPFYNNLNEDFFELSNHFNLQVGDFYESAFKKLTIVYVDKETTLFAHQSIEDTFKTVLHQNRTWFKYIKYLGGKKLIWDVLQSNFYSDSEKNEIVVKIIEGKNLSQIAENLELLPSLIIEHRETVTKSLFSIDFYTRFNLQHPYEVFHFLHKLTNYIPLFENKTNEWFDKLAIDILEMNTGEEGSNLRDIGLDLSDLKFKSESLVLLRELDSSSFNRNFNDSHKIKDLMDKFKNLLSRILENYNPRGIELYNDYGRNFQILFGDYGFTFQDYDDEENRSTYNQQIEEEQWDSWFDGPISEWTLIDGGAMEIQFNCCREQIKAFIDIPSPYMMADKARDSERYSDTEEIVCNHCGREYSIYVGNDLYELTAYWEYNEPEEYEYRILNNANIPNDEDESWETWP